MFETNKHSRFFHEVFVEFVHRPLFMRCRSYSFGRMITIECVMRLYLLLSFPLHFIEFISWSCSRSLLSFHSKNKHALFLSLPLSLTLPSSLSLFHSVGLRRLIIKIFCSQPCSHRKTSQDLNGNQTYAQSYILSTNLSFTHTCRSARSRVFYGMFAADSSLSLFLLFLLFHFVCLAVRCQCCAEYSYRLVFIRLLS